MFSILSNKQFFAAHSIIHQIESFIHAGDSIAIQKSVLKNMKSSKLSKNTVSSIKKLKPKEKLSVFKMFKSFMSVFFVWFPIKSTPIGGDIVTDTLLVNDLHEEWSSVTSMPTNTTIYAQNNSEGLFLKLCSPFQAVVHKQWQAQFSQWHKKIWYIVSFFSISKGILSLIKNLLIYEQHFKNKPIQFSIEEFWSALIPMIICVSFNILVAIDVTFVKDKKMISTTMKVINMIFSPIWPIYTLFLTSIIIFKSKIYPKDSKKNTDELKRLSIISNNAHLIEVITESSLQPLVQVFSIYLRLAYTGWGISLWTLRPQPRTSLYAKKLMFCLRFHNNMDVKYLFH